MKNKLNLAFKILVGFTCIAFWVVLIISVTTRFITPDPNKDLKGWVTEQNQELRNYVSTRDDQVTKSYNDGNTKLTDFVNSENTKLHDWVNSHVWYAK